MKKFVMLTAAVASMLCGGAANAAISFDIGPGWGAEFKFTSPTPVILFSDVAELGGPATYYLNGDYRSSYPGSPENPDGGWGYGGFSNTFVAVGSPTTRQLTLGSYNGGDGTIRFHNTDGQKVTITFADDIRGTVSRLALPEPATWAMMLIGFGAIGSAMRRRTTLSATLANG